MIYKDKAKNRIMGGFSFPTSQTAAIEFAEQCCVCGKTIPDNQNCMRHEETKEVVCIECVVNICLEAKS